jgi:hypothetical protein
MFFRVLRWCCAILFIIFSCFLVKEVFAQPENNHTSDKNGMGAFIGSEDQDNGVIEADEKTVKLNSGNKISVSFENKDFVLFTIDDPEKTSAIIPRTTLSQAIKHLKEIPSGKIIITAQVAQEILDKVINMSGIAHAKSFVARNGQIVLLSQEAGKLRIAGKINISRNKALPVVQSKMLAKAKQIMVKPVVVASLAPSVKSVVKPTPVKPIVVASAAPVVKPIPAKPVVVASVAPVVKNIPAKPVVVASVASSVKPVVKPIPIKPIVVATVTPVAKIIPAELAAKSFSNHENKNVKLAENNIHLRQLKPMVPENPPVNLASTSSLSHEIQNKALNLAKSTTILRKISDVVPAVNYLAMNHERANLKQSVFENNLNVSDARQIKYVSNDSELINKLFPDVKKTQSEHAVKPKAVQVEQKPKNEIIVAIQDAAPEEQLRNEQKEYEQKITQAKNVNANISALVEHTDRVSKRPNKLCVKKEGEKQDFDLTDCKS